MPIWEMLTEVLIHSGKTKTNGFISQHKQCQHKIGVEQLRAINTALLLIIFTILARTKYLDVDITSNIVFKIQVLNVFILPLRTLLLLSASIITV